MASKPAWREARVLSTRVCLGGLVRRRYQDSQGRRFSTIEVPEPALRRLVRLETLDAAAGGFEPPVADERKALAESMFEYGYSPQFAAPRLSTTVAQARRWYDAWRRKQNRLTQAAQQ